MFEVIDYSWKSEQTGKSLELVLKKRDVAVSLTFVASYAWLQL
jgi:hypothetical protein